MSHRGSSSNPDGSDLPAHSNTGDSDIGDPDIGDPETVPDDASHRVDPTPNFDAPISAPSGRPPRVALLGNPNTGKTTLFNRLCGTRAKTANYTGITADARVGRVYFGHEPVEVVDLPGAYGLDLDSPESELCRSVLGGTQAKHARPDALMIVVEATNLERNLTLALEVLTLRQPTLVVVNMQDIARKQGLEIDFPRLSEELGCPAVPLSARSGEGIESLMKSLRELVTNRVLPSRSPAEYAHLSSSGDSSSEDPRSSHAIRAIQIADHVSEFQEELREKHLQFTDRLDNLFTHRLWGSLIFLGLMTGLFYTLFSVASYPMDAIDMLFGSIGGIVQSWIPDGDLQSFVVDGVIGGIAGTLVFLPQICMLFFLLALLEDTGYLARAAFLIDGVMRRFGLPGHAFVPLLTSHACALPGIMSARLIPEWRDRLATILVAPFMSCSARLPVYTLLVSFLFGDRPLVAALAFLGCYALGGIAALLTAAMLRKTLIPGRTSALMLELPSYKAPSLQSALLVTYDRGRMFVKKAGTVILLICIALWALQSYPKPNMDQLLPAIVAYDAAEHYESKYLPGAEGEDRERYLKLIEKERALGQRIENRVQLRESLAGRAGQALEPIFAPIGAEWRLTIAILTSFAAREVFASTLLVTLGLNEDEEDGGRILDTIRTATRNDGSPLLTPASAAALLVFYVLALQCLPTLAVTRREAGGWHWALFQLTYMTAVAYGAAWATFQIVLRVNGE